MPHEMSWRVMGDAYWGHWFLVLGLNSVDAAPWHARQPQEPPMRQYIPLVLAIPALLPALGACTEEADPARITASAPARSVASADGLDAKLGTYLATLGYTGRIGSTLEARLGRRIDHQVAEVGRMLWFDPIGGLNNDNTCGGCHSPTNGFGDTQSIAIGIDNNGVVGPGRRGPRNQRREIGRAHV